MAASEKGHKVVRAMIEKVKLRIWSYNASSSLFKTTDVLAQQVA